MTRYVVAAIVLAALYSAPAIHDWYVLNFTDRIAFSIPR